MSVFNNSPDSREWLKHIWNDATLEWLLTLDAGELDQVWVSTFELAAKACLSNPGDPRLLPSEDFLIRLLKRANSEQYEGKSEGENFLTVEDDQPNVRVGSVDDPLLEAIQSADRELVDALFGMPGVLRGIQFDLPRAERFFDGYVAPFLTGEGARVGMNLTDAIAAPTFPQEIVRKTLQLMVEQPVKSYVSFSRLSTWNAYLSGAKGASFLAECADIIMGALKSVPNRNRDNGLYVNLLAATTSHPLFPASWVEKHYLDGNHSYPIATHNDLGAFKQKYPQSGSNTTVLWQTKKDQQANQVTDLGLFVMWSVPGMVDDEQALARGRKLATRTSRALTTGNLPTLGYYLHRLEQIKTELGTPDIPDEWAAELLS